MGESSDLPYEVVTKPQVNSMLKYTYYTNIRKNKIVSYNINNNGKLL
jgi:hypothetical protein